MTRLLTNFLGTVIAVVLMPAVLVVVGLMLMVDFITGKD